MPTNDGPVHDTSCTGCDLCKTFELASQLLEMIRNGDAAPSVELNALIVAAGYNSGREGDHLETVLDTFRYAWVLGRRERDAPDEGGRLTTGPDRAPWCPMPAAPPRSAN